MRLYVSITQFAMHNQAYFLEIFTDNDAAVWCANITTIDYPKECYDDVCESELSKFEKWKGNKSLFCHIHKRLSVSSVQLQCCKLSEVQIFDFTCWCLIQLSLTYQRALLSLYLYQWRAPFKFSASIAIYVKVCHTNSVISIYICFTHKAVVVSLGLVNKLASLSDVHVIQWTSTDQMKNNDTHTNLLLINLTEQDSRRYMCALLMWFFTYMALKCFFISVQGLFHIWCWLDNHVCHWKKP